MPLAFRRLSRRDFALLSEWLAAPHVETWWRQDHRAAAVEAEYGPVVDGDDPTEVFIVEDRARPIGLIQRYRLSDHPEWERAMPAGTTPEDGAGIDYLIGDETHIGHGLGGRIITAFVADTWDRYPDVPAIVVAVQQENRRSWRALEKAQFHRVWAGMLDSDDPSDAGPSYVYVRPRAVGLNPGASGPLGRGRARAGPLG